jgi:hypothetical protein
MADRSSLLIQILDSPSYNALGDDDKALCMALHDALCSTLYGERFGPPVTQTIRTKLLAWSRGREERWRTDPAIIERTVEDLERAGYPRTRSDSTVSGADTALSLAARQLGIEQNTVANKVPPRYPVTFRDREK